MSKFFPDDYIKSVYDVDFSALYKEGYRLLLFDVDNTLVPHGAPADERAKALFSELKEMGYKVYFLSNNKEGRVKSFCEAVGGDGYIFKCNKPSPRAYLRAIALSGVSKDEALFFGDQIFTDVMGAKNAGIRNAMVEPVLKWKEEPQIVLKRFLEAIVLLFFKPNLKSNKGIKKIPMK